MEDKVLLTRLRPSDYYVNYKNGLKSFTFKWLGATKGRKPHTQAVPREVFDDLNMAGSTISSGELVVADEQPNKEEVVSQILELEQVQNNTHTREEIEEILRGNTNKMKTALSKITVREEIAFVKNIADELEDELTGAKSKWLADWVSGKSEEAK